MEEKVNPTVVEIVKAFLKQNGYDGLYNTDRYCRCQLSDLVPCGEIGSDCQAGFKVPCPGGDDYEAYGDCDFHIQGTNPNP